jgi:ANTAR domain/PAS fold
MTYYSLSVYPEPSDPASLPLESIQGRDGESAESTESVGWFRHYFASDEWEWSDEVYRIHGYAPGAPEITTSLVLSHKHPDDRERLAAALERIRADLKPLSSRHRIIDTNGVERSIVAGGDLLRDTDGAIIGTHGFYIDVTESETRTQERISRQVAEIAKTREVIEQAKGMLMAVYGLDSDAAFEILRWRSQHTNTKLHTLAEQLVAEFKTLGTAAELNRRDVYDHVVMTCHKRLASRSATQTQEITGFQTLGRDRPA